MKRILIAALAFIGIVSLNVAFAADEKMQHEGHHHDMSMMDTRISLELSAEMKQHQLSNMREHVEAIKSIIGFMSENKFEDASKVAHTKLGLTPEVQKMCSMFNDEKFMTLGFAFDNSADQLGDVLQSKDMNKSLQALQTTMDYCVQCHSTFRQ